MDRGVEIQSALNGIKQASESDVAISRSTVSEIERLVGIVNSQTDNEQVRREGELLVSRALGRYPGRASGESPSAVVSAARLHGAIARYEFILRVAGLLGMTEATSPRPEIPSA